MASSEPSDLELVIFNFIRNHYEKKHKQNVPMSLKDLIIQFSNRIIGCTFLSITQDFDFFKLLSTKLSSIRKFNHLYKASDHQYSAAKFHEFCDNKPNTIIIIRSNWGNIFGGYTSKSWISHSNWQYVRDENAFLFLIQSDDESIQIKCPLLFEVKKNFSGHAICNSRDYGPIFGGGNDIRIQDDCNKKLPERIDSFKENGSCQGSFCIDINNICGGNLTDGKNEKRFVFQVVDYSVFQLV